MTSRREMLDSWQLPKPLRAELKELQDCYTTLVANLQSALAGDKRAAQKLWDAVDSYQGNEDEEEFKRYPGQFVMAIQHVQDKEQALAAAHQNATDWANRYCDLWHAVNRHELWGQLTTYHDKPK